MHAFATAIPLLLRRPPARCARRPRPSKIRAAYVDLEAVKRAVRLSDVLRDLGTVSQLRQRGDDEWMACCPFHDDSSPSLSINDKRGLYFCFGCGATGDVIEFERRSRGLKTVPDALASLATRYSSVRELMTSSPRFAPVAPTMTEQPAVRQLVNWGSRVRERKSVKSILHNTVALYVETLHEKAGAVYRDYLKSRGITERTIRAFQIGAAGPPKAWSFARDALIKAGYSEDELLHSGIIVKSKAGKVFDAFRSRLVFPICDEEGVPLAIAGRLLSDSARAPKYVNSKETLMFKKKSILFGSHLARDALLAKVPLLEEKLLVDESDDDDDYYDDGDDDKEEELDLEEINSLKRQLESDIPVVEQFVGVRTTKISLVVVEGYMDVLALFEHSQGTFPAVATMGTAVSVEQVHAMLELLPNPFDCSVIFNFDGDEAGVRAAERLCDVVLPEVPEAFCASIAFAPESVKDVDQYLNNGHGTADDYMKHLRDTAMLWTTWRGGQIVKRELEWIKRRSEDEDELRDIPESNGKPPPSIETGEDGRLIVDGIPQDLNETSESQFNFRLADELIRQSDLMLLKFGAPKKELMRIHEPRRKKISLECRPQVIDELANFLVNAERAVPGLNSSELIFSWADTLAGPETEAIPSLVDRIASRRDEIAGGPDVNSPFANIDLYPPAPWVLDELPPRQRKKVMQDNDLANISKSVQKLHELKARIERERREIEEPIEARRCKASKRVETHPRASAEERVLRALIRCSTEEKRLEALEGAIEIMVDVQERGGRFWTSAARNGLFELLVQIEGDADIEEIASMCEDKEWWSFEIEDLFIDDDEGDEEWTELMQLDRDEPAWTAVFAARIVDNMERAIRGRLAAGRMGEVFAEEENAKYTGDFEKMDQMVAKRLVLEREIKEMVNLSEKDKALVEEEERIREEELRNERKEAEILRILDAGGELPFKPPQKEKTDA